MDWYQQPIVQTLLAGAFGAAGFLAGRSKPMFRSRFRRTRTWSAASGFGVFILDDVLNNTSVILLFEVPGVRPMKLLFPGDAQIENWEYALKVAPDRKTNLDMLRKVDLYKVGHHGSRNATPRTLFNLWHEPATATHPMTAVMSTKANVHGDSPATAVPRKTLVAALDTRMEHLYSTQQLTSGSTVL